LGSMTTAEAINLVNGQVVGTAEADFQSQPMLPPPDTYSLINVVLPGEPVLPGESFTISGMISPPPQGSLAGYNVVAMWRSDGGQAFPISEGPANIQASGQFDLPAHIPSPLWGDPQTSSQVNEIGLALLTPAGAGSPSYDTIPASSFLELMILVRDLDTGEPVEGAKVDIEFAGWDGGGLSPGLSAAGPDSLADIHAGDGLNQVEDLAFDQDEWWLQMQCDGKDTDDSGYLEAKLHPEMPIINVMMGADEWRAMYNAAPGTTAGQAGAIPARGARAGAWVPPGSGWLHYKILVDGLPACYGPPGADGSAQQDIYEKTVWFNKSSGELRDEDGNLLSIPYTVYLKKISPGLCGEGILVGMNLGNARGEKLCPDGEASCPRWGGLVSFAPVQGQVSLAGLHDLQVYFSLKAEDAIEIKDPKLYLDGVFKGDFEKESYTIDGEKYCEPDTAHDPHYLTGDGATYWESAATFDPVGNSIVAMAVQGTPVSIDIYQQLQAAPRRNWVQAVSDGSSVVFAHTPRVPDYVVAALAPSDRHPQPGDMVTVDVQLRNDGIASAAPVTITATWDGGPGIGTLAGESELSTMAAGQPLTLTLNLAEPPGGYDLPHELVVTINCEQRYSELDVSDNSLSTTLGGLPAPSDVTASARKGSPIVFLTWAEVDDPRIAGYRVYRAAGGDDPMPVGSTFVPGFVDLTTELDRTYHYTVVSFTEDGIESESDNVVDVTLEPWRSYLPLLGRGF
jgi:hypothetical protein